MANTGIKNLRIDDLGLIDYKEAWDYQQKLLDSSVDTRIRKKETPVNHLLVCEHPHVYTLGKHGEQQNLLISEDFLKSVHASFYRIDRGGDITYHGPGQIVCYPIIDLDQTGYGIRSYIERLESGVINTLKSFNIEGYRLKNITGVWVKDQTTATDKKICAIGVRVSRMITMHGLAFNINTDLKYFSYINPCGFMDKGVTSLQEILGREVRTDEVKNKLVKELTEELEFA